LRLLVDDRWIGPHGIGRFAGALLARLPVSARMPRGLGPTHPLDPIWTTLQLARRPCEVYFEPGYNPPLASAAPFVFTIHDLIHLKAEGEKTLAKRLYYERIVRPATRRAYRVLTVSEYSKREIGAWAGIPLEQVVVASNGVSPGFTPEGDRFALGCPYLLYIGNRKPHKNLPGILNAFAASRCAASMVLLLSGSPDRETRQWIRDAGLNGDQVRFAGYIPDRRLPAYYRGAVALAIPSLDEGFGLPALEAMACGTPVLAGNRGALPEVVGDAGLLVDPTLPASMAEGLDRIATDQELRSELARRGVERATRFRWEDSAQIVRSLLEAAASGSAHPESE
jgi:glycosyltransferase involved in cell wall biosynthesis